MLDKQPTKLRLVKEEARARHGMVATKDRAATQAGVDILEAGGNAVDAAVAACFAVGVVEPASSGIGGGGYLVYQVGDKGGVVGFPIRAPRKAKPDMFALTGEPSVGIFGWVGVVDNANLEGYRSIATPGAVAGLCEAHRRLGRLPLVDVMAPAVRLAREGYTPSWLNLFGFGLLAGTLIKYDELRRIFMPGDEMPAGDYESPPNLQQPELADVLETIGNEGPTSFYRGDVAQAIASDIQLHGGELTIEDLASYKPFVWEHGLEILYRGYTVRVPPFACAGITSAMTLKMMDGFDVRHMGHNSVEKLHTYICSARLAYADRYAYLADPETADAPWDELLSETYTDRRRATIRSDVPSIFDPGDPWREARRMPNSSKEPSRPAYDNGTTHLSVIDREGNAVSLTNTVGSGFGSGIVPSGTGVVMNNGMLWFDPVPGRMASIEPSKLPLNNMTPALVMDDDNVRFAVGASGGRRITNCVTQLIMKLVDFGMRPQDAIDSPRVDCSMPYTSVGASLNESIIASLRAKGHRLKVIDGEYIEGGFAYFASPVAIAREADGGFIAGVDTFNSAHASGP